VGVSCKSSLSYFHLAFCSGHLSSGILRISDVNCLDIFFILYAGVPFNKSATVSFHFQFTLHNHRPVSVDVERRVQLTAFLTNLLMEIKSSRIQVVWNQVLYRLSSRRFRGTTVI
jgi:hypothetical protein